MENKLFRLSIRMNNSAFENVNGQELARILRALADKIEEDNLDNGDTISLHDINGNRVGTAETLDD